MKIVAISGGFDPIHPGHIRLIQKASKLGNYLIVILNNDNWLLQKRKDQDFKEVFQNEQARKEIIEALRYVDEVVLSSHEPNCTDMSICKELSKLDPDIFANGGDRKPYNIPEFKICKDQHIQMVFNVGGSKIAHSSQIVKKKC